MALAGPLPAKGSTIGGLRFHLILDVDFCLGEQPAGMDALRRGFRECRRESWCLYTADDVWPVLLVVCIEPLALSLARKLHHQLIQGADSARRKPLGNPSLLVPDEILAVQPSNHLGPRCPPLVNPIQLVADQADEDQQDDGNRHPHGSAMERSGVSIPPL